MLAALQARRIGGAALDVFDHEPLPRDHPLRRLDNVVATPHVGYVSREHYAHFYRETAENTAAFPAGPPRNVIEPVFGAGSLSCVLRDARSAGSSRSDERRIGKESCSQCISRWQPVPIKKTQHHTL